MTKGKNRQFPHLLAEDISVWEDFLRHSGMTFDSIDYDVRVGEGRDVPKDTPPAAARDWEHLTKRRIDAVGNQGRLRYIIEITHTAGLRAIGQLIAYPILYKRTFGFTQLTRPLLVAGRLQPNIEPVLTAYKILYWVQRR